MSKAYWAVIEGLDKKTKVFKVSWRLFRMYEVPDKALIGTVDDITKSSVSTYEVKSEGVPAEPNFEQEEQVKAPSRETQRDVKETKTKSSEIHKFLYDKENNPVLWAGDPFGVFRTLMRNTITAMKKRGYKYNPVTQLINIEPQWAVVQGGTGCDGIDTFLEKRVMARPFFREFRVPVSYEYVGTGLIPGSPHNGERIVDLYFLLAPECPLKNEEFFTLLHGMQMYYGAGPTKRGRVRIVENGIKKIKWEDYVDLRTEFPIKVRVTPPELPEGTIDIDDGIS